MRICSTPDCGRKHQARGYCGSCYNRNFPNPSPQALTPCTVCGTMVMKDKRDHTKRQPVCSDMCKTFLAWGHWPIAMVTDRPKPPKPRLPPREPFDHAPRECDWCSAVFVPTSKRTRFCDASCRDAEKSKARRARIRGVVVAPVNRQRIFERDKWRCKLCGKPVARTKVAPHPKSPVLDHIVPLAKGGEHAPVNLQCAHFMCNTLKSDGGGGEQLMLIG